MSAIQLINNLGDSTAVRDRDELEHSIARLFRQYLDACSVAMYRVQREDNVTRMARRILLARDGDAASAPQSAELLQTLDPALPGALHQCVVRREVRQEITDAGDILTAFPAEGERGEIIGVVLLQSHKPLGHADSLLIRGILRIIKNYVALLDYSERDTLTGLLNRKTFESQFDKLRHGLLAAPAAVGAPAQGWLGLIDIDRFKSINDTYGHLFGDEVLLLVSQLIKRTLRSADHVYRFGGEEFVLLLYGMSEESAAVVFERLRAAIEAYAFPQVGRVTISLGWTELSAQDAAASCLERADAALYHAKESGRNRCCRQEAMLGATPRVAGDIELF